jgi:hypothetical protein
MMPPNKSRSQPPLVRSIPLWQLRRESAVVELSVSSEMRHDIYHWTHVMKKRTHQLDDPGQQLFWKITLTLLCAIIGAIAAHYLFGLF